jgi:hypothetical protein
VNVLNKIATKKAELDFMDNILFISPKSKIKAIKFTIKELTTQLQNHSLQSFESILQKQNTTLKLN